MRLRYMATNYAGSGIGSARGTHGQPLLLFPWRYEDNAAISYGDITPFALDDEEMSEWWWRFRALTLSVGITSSDGNPSASFTLTRKILAGATATVESDLMLPGAVATDNGASPDAAYDTFSGTYTATNWNGDPDSTISINATARICFCGDLQGTNSTVIGERCQYDTGTSLWVPSVEVYADFFFTTPGSELTYTFQNYEDNETTPGTFRDEPVTASIFPSHGGGNLAMHMISNLGYDGVGSLTLTPSLWWEYALDDGTKPVWNSATGARIRSRMQSPV